MPTRTEMLNRGNFVRSPQFPADAAFAAYLRGIDGLLARWRRVSAAWDESPFAPEVLEQKQRLEAAIDECVEAFGGLYALPSVQHDPRFLTVGAFFARYRPIRTPFAVLHCDGRLPLHTVAEFADECDLRALNAALNEDAPLRWWQDGPSGRPYYLFGECVWELKPSEVSASDKGLTLHFLEELERDRVRRDRLRSAVLCPARACAVVPEAVRATVYRRDRGKCARCGGREGLDFAFITPPGRGGASTADNVQLLCARCASRSQ